jgi:diguanylate cyclase (GGDEF)-like protein
LPSAIQRSKLIQKRLALFYLDLDNFKDINDSLGHKAGDEILCSVAEALRSVLDKNDQVARLGGDEFILIIEHLESEQQAEEYAIKIGNAIRRVKTSLPKKIFTFWHSEDLHPIVKIHIDNWKKKLPEWEIILIISINLIMET